MLRTVSEHDCQINTPVSPCDRMSSCKWKHLAFKFVTIQGAHGQETERGVRQNGQCGKTKQWMSLLSEETHQSMSIRSHGSSITALTGSHSVIERNRHVYAAVTSAEIALDIERRLTSFSLTRQMQSSIGQLALPERSLSRLLHLQRNPATSLSQT